MRPWTPGHAGPTTEKNINVVKKYPIPFQVFAALTALFHNSCTSLSVGLLLDLAAARSRPLVETPLNCRYRVRHMIFSPVITRIRFFRHIPRLRLQDNIFVSFALDSS